MRFGPRLAVGCLGPTVLAACLGGKPQGIRERTSSAELLEVADTHFDARRFENAVEMYKMAAVAASSEGDAAHFVEATALVALVYVQLGRVEEGRSWFERAAERADRADAEAWGRYLLAKGSLQHAGGAPGGALATFEEAFHFASQNELQVRVVQAAHLASVVATGEDQVQWSRKALGAARDLGDLRLEARLWSQLAWLLEERGLADEALAAFAQARRAAREVEDEHLLLVADWSYGHGLRVAGRLAEARSLLEKVADQADRSYAARRRPNDAEWIGHAQRELAEALDVAEGYPRRALSRLQRAREHLLRAGAEDLAPRAIRDVERRIANLTRELEERSE